LAASWCFYPLNNNCMNSSTNWHSLTLIFLLPVLHCTVKGQSITGDTLFINNKVEISVRFPSTISTFTINPLDAQVNRRSMDNTLYLNAKSNQMESASLSLAEGGRNHQFYLVYKKNIPISNPDALNIDYSTTAKIEDRNRQKAAADAVVNNKFRFLSLTAAAKQYVGQKKYKEAKDSYEQALLLKPNDPGVVKELKKVNKLLDAANKTKPVTTTDEEITTPVTDLNVYTKEELAAKYPGIDFSKPPVEQQYFSNAYNAKKNEKTLNRILSESPRIDINGKDNKVKLVCQAIYQEDNNIFIKLLVQNSSKKDFLTGAMMLSWKKKSGELYGLYPVYLYPTAPPGIKPGKETVLVYVCQPAAIADDDNLKFEMSDRSKKTNLAISFKGSVYNTERRH